MNPPNDAWNAHLYDTKHAFVFGYGEGVVDLLAPQSGERILDVGCGTGHLTAKIAQAGAQVFGIDASPAMIEQARALFPELSFLVADATHFAFDEPFDAVFSNATLHWISAKEPVLESVYRALKPGGRFVAEFGGKGNVNHIVRAIDKVLLAHSYPQQVQQNPWYFPSLGEYTTLLEKHGFRVNLAAHFDRETLLEDRESGILDWIDMFGKAFFVGIPSEAKPDLLRLIQQELAPTNYKDGRWFADYVRLRFVAFKQM